MTTAQVQGPAVHVQGLEKSYKELQVLRGVDFDVARGSIFALLGSNGAGKTTVVNILSTPAQGRRGDRQRQRLRCRHPGCERARVHQPHRTVRGRRRDPQRAGEPRPDRPAAAPQGPGRDRGRPARALRLDRCGRAEGVDLLGWHAPPARHRDEPHRQSAGHLPRRADDRARPAGAPRGVAGRQGTRRAGHDGAAHDAVSRRGRTARRPDRDPPRGSDHRERHPRRAQAAAPARQGRVRREAADPRGRLLRHRRRPRPGQQRRPRTAAPARATEERR